MGPKDSLVNTIFGFGLMICSVYCGCFLALHGWLLQRWKNHVLAKKRRKKIALIQIAFSVVALVFGIPMSILSHFYWNFSPSEDTDAYKVVLILNDVLFAGAVYTAFFHGMLR